MERKELLKSQRALMQIKVAQADAAQAEAQATINLIASELGIDPKETWRLTPDGAAFEKPEPETK